MPVLDHPVHDSTKVSSDFKYGCWNRKAFKDHYFIAVRQSYSLISVPKRIDHKMSTECRYDLSQKDKACDGCAYQGIGKLYFEQVENGLRNNATNGSKAAI